MSMSPDDLEVTAERLRRQRREQRREQRRHGRHGRHRRRHRRRGLQRTLFWAFGVAIALTGLAAWGVHRLVPAPGPGWQRAIYVLAPVFVLWSFAGLWARKLAWPLEELTRVARALGEGRLDARARLRHGPGEVGQLALAMNDMAARLEDKIRAERELLAGVSHELRTPLARARVLVELAREGRAGGRDVHAELEREIDEMDELVGALLASARVDGGALSPRPLDLAELTRRLAAREPELVVDVPAPAPALTADATLVARALAAILDNARKHGGGARRLRVSTSGPAGERVAITVDDAGPGFAAADLPGVFEPFVRGGAAAHDERRGVGLGLALVRRIARLHGGEARAENLPGGGARVTLELPAAPPAPSA